MRLQRGPGRLRQLAQRVFERFLRSLSVSTSAFILGECPHTFVMKEKTQFVSSSYRFGHIL